MVSNGDRNKRRFLCGNKDDNGRKAVEQKSRGKSSNRNEEEERIHKVGKRSLSLLLPSPSLTRGDGEQNG